MNFWVNAHFFWVHTHFFQKLKTPPFWPCFTNSLPITHHTNGLIPSPTFLDRNSNVLFSVFLPVLKSVHSVHSVHTVCTCLPDGVHGQNGCSGASCSAGVAFAASGSRRCNGLGSTGVLLLSLNDGARLSRLEELVLLANDTDESTLEVARAALIAVASLQL